MTSTPDEAMRAVEATCEVNELLHLYQLAKGKMAEGSEPSRWWRVAVAAAESAGLENEAMLATLLLWEIENELPADAPSIESIVEWAVSAAEERRPSDLGPALRDELVRRGAIDELKAWRRLKNRLALLRGLPRSYLTDSAIKWLEKWSLIP